MFELFRKKKPVERIYEFSTWEIPAFGEAYFYKVKAKSRAEAFKQLVEYFYGETNPEVESKTKEIHYPNKEIFVCNGMPIWFARRIGGTAICSKTGKNYQKQLERYCIDNNIKIK